MEIACADRSHFVDCSILAAERLLTNRSVRCAASERRGRRDVRGGWTSRARADRSHPGTHAPAAPPCPALQRAATPLQHAGDARRRRRPPGGRSRSLAPGDARSSGPPLPRLATRSDAVAARSGCPARPPPPRSRRAELAPPPACRSAPPPDFGPALAVRGRTLPRTGGRRHALRASRVAPDAGPALKDARRDTENAGRSQFDMNAGHPERENRSGSRAEYVRTALAVARIAGRAARVRLTPEPARPARRRNDAPA